MIDIMELVGHHVMDHVIFGGHIFGIPIVLTKHIAMLGISAALVLGGVLFAAKHASSIPSGFYNLMEIYVLFIRDKIVMPSIGHDGEKYLGYFLSLFLFVLVANLVGLIPGSATATANIVVTGTLALCTLSLIFFAGIRSHGAWGYVKSFIPQGVPPALVPLVFVLEVFGLFIRCLVLAVRLFANMLAGHVVMLLFFALVFLVGTFYIAPVAIGIVIFIMFIELLVAFLQAYIFTMLSAIFVGLTVHSH